MSFLAPLYALGALAVLGPVLFHLIRRAPRGEVPFGSLMFLAPSPPRLSRRSRLDNVLLLLLRAGAVLLLALAFARPYLGAVAQVDTGGPGRRRVVLLVDTSASLRRPGLWDRARAAASAVVDGCRPDDELAVYAFDTTTRPVLSFAESAALGPGRRGAVAHARVDALAPTWNATDLGRALVDAASAVAGLADTADQAAAPPRRVVLVGDLQRGARLDALADFQWPADVDLELVRLADQAGDAAVGNAGLSRLADAAPGTAVGESSAAGAEAGIEPAVRMRVSNEPGSRRESFELAWRADTPGNAATNGAVKPMAAYVPPGESRVVSLPRPAGRRAVVLRGDGCEFDNTWFVADEPRAEALVVCLGGGEAADPAGLLYYLERVFADTPRRRVRVKALDPAGDVDWGPVAPSLVVLGSEAAPGVVARLREYLRGGGTVLAVVAGPGRVESVAALAGVEPWEAVEPAPGPDLMLGEVAFDHPLFAPLAGPQFNDFTKIRFWKYRRIPPGALGPSARVLARFDNGDAAVAEAAVGRGRLVVLASGWRPADSQLARSSKFVPLMNGLLDGPAPATPADPRGHLVGDLVPVPAGATVRTPGGRTVRLDPGAASFAEPGEPGVYAVTAGAGGTREFAVNVDPAEGRTAPLEPEALEQFGCRLTGPQRRSAEAARLRQLRGAELEGRQKVWRGLVLAAAGVLLVETWLAGRRPRSMPVPSEALTT